MINLQYLADKSGNTTAVQLQIPIEEWASFKEKHEEFEDENTLSEESVPDWHIALGRESLKKIADGTAELIEWDKVKDSFKM
jgi:hypothetical protein